MRTGLAGCTLGAGEEGVAGEVKAGRKLAWGIRCDVGRWFCAPGQSSAGTQTAVSVRAMEASIRAPFAGKSGFVPKYMLEADFRFPCSALICRPASWVDVQISAVVEITCDARLGTFLP